MAGKCGRKKFNGLSAHNKPQKEKAIAKRAAATGKSKDQDKKASLDEGKVEHEKVQTTVQDNSVKNILETGAAVTRSAIAPVSSSVVAHDEVPNGLDDAVSQEFCKHSFTTLSANSLSNMFAVVTLSHQLTDVIDERKSQEDMLLANMETPKQRFKRICYISSKTTDEIQPWDDEREPAVPTAAARAGDDNGFECIDFRIKDIAQQIADHVSVVDQLFSIVADEGTMTTGISGTSKVAHFLETIEKRYVPISIHPLSTIAEEDTNSMSHCSGSTTDDEGFSALSSTMEEIDFFSRSATPFSNATQKQTPIVRLPSAAGSSPTHAVRSRESTKAGSACYHDNVIKDSEMPFDPMTLVCQIIVNHNVEEGTPTREQIRAALVFTCPEECLKAFASDTVAVVDPAIVSLKGKKHDARKIPNQDPTELKDHAILNCTLKGHSPNDLASQSPLASGPHDQSFTTSLQHSPELLKTALGISTQDPSSSRTSHDSGTNGALPSPKDDSGPHTPLTPTFNKNAVLSAYCEKNFVPAKDQNTTVFTANGGYNYPSYQAFSPGQYWPEQVYAQYQQPYICEGGYSPYEGVPEYYEKAWKVIGYGMR